MSKFLGKALCALGLHDAVFCSKRLEALERAFDEHLQKHKNLSS